MIRMVSTSNHVYAGRALSAEDEFDCEPQHVVVMEVLGRGRKKEETQTYLTRDLVARKRGRPRLSK